MNAQHTPGPAMPEGMQAVSKDQFFALLSADPRDIMPSTGAPDYTTWETKGREVWGWTTPGWKVPRAPVQFAVLRSAIAKATGGAV